MVRGILVALFHLVSVPVYSIVAIVGDLLFPGREWIPRVGAAWSRHTLRLAGVRVEVRGAEILARNRPAVLAANHTSAMDIYAVCANVPVPYRMVAKAELFRIPLFGAALLRAGFVPLQRRPSRKDLQAIERVREDLAKGAIVCFFPEGTRSPDGRLRPFKTGAFVLAIREGIPVIPVAIHGAYRVQRRGSLLIRPATIVFEVLPPIPTAGRELDERMELARECHDRIAAALPPDQRPA